MGRTSKKAPRHTEELLINNLYSVNYAGNRRHQN